MSRGSGPGRPLAARLTEAEPSELARLVSESPDEDLQEALSGELRGAILDHVFECFPELVDPEKTRGVDAAIEWRISGDPEDRYTVVIEDDEVRAGRDLEAPEPRTTISLDGVDFLRLVTGNANPTMLFFRGRLNVGGDLAFATKVAGFFEAA